MSLIHGARTLLRPIEERDFECFHVWMNDPEIAWWMDYDRPYAIEDIAADAAQARGEGLPLTIVFDDKPIGRIGLNRFRQKDQIASAYMFVGDPEYRGRGLARDAMIALLAFAFYTKGLRMVDLMVLAENDRALASYAACGFREDGRLRERSWKDDRWMDHVWLSITVQEFESARAASDGH